MGKKLFEYVIGNPPYNEDFENSGDNGNFAKPVYNQFMDAVNGVAEKVELIHPARFLFNAGSTPKAWNEKMLNDPHFKILSYEADCSKVFPISEQLALLLLFRSLTELSESVEPKMRRRVFLP